VSRHFAEHRAFYRALFTGPCAFALDRGLLRLLLPVNRDGVRRLCGGRLAPDAVDDLAAYLTGGAAALITAWVVDGDDPLDPEAFTDRLLRTVSVLTTAMSEGTR
jgi:hypothetical protein